MSSVAYDRLRGAIDTQARVIVALALRRLSGELGSTTRIVVMATRPFMLVVPMYLIITLTHRLTPQGMSVLAFCVTGWLPWFGFHRTFMDLSKGEAGGVITLFPHVTPLDVFIGNLVFEVFVYTTVFSVFCLGALLLERSAPPAQPLYVILAFWGVEALGATLGLIFNSIGRIFPLLLQFNILIRRGGFLISGVALTAADTPYPFLQILKWNPVFQCFEIMRQAWWPAYVSPIAHPAYVFEFLFFALAIGLAAERFTRRYIE